MPDGTNEIYVDATFYTTGATSDGTEDVNAELTLADADVIGAYNMPTVFTTSATTPAAQETSIEYYKTSGTVSGFIERDVEYYINTASSGVYTSLVDYSIGAVISGSLNRYVDCFLAGQTSISGVPGTTPGSQNLIAAYTVGEVFDELDIELRVTYWTWISYSGTESFSTQYTYLPGINTTIERDVYISLGSYSTMTSGTQTGYVDCEFAGYVTFPLSFDLFCAVSGTPSMNSDITVISGSVDTIFYDLYCATSGIDYTPFDVYCGLEVSFGTYYDLTVISGGLYSTEVDMYCSGTDEDSLSFDVDLLSLKISNFQPEEDEYHLSSQGISVDITDDIYSVLTSASGIPCSGTCCLKVDGTPVPVTFSGITDGYRMYYNPGDFTSVLGSTTFTVHAENNNGISWEKDYYLTSGYLMDYENLQRDHFDYGIGRQVLVRMSAENMVTCPRYSAESYWFETRDYSQSDLSASITGEYPEIRTTSANLGASISPQSTAFFYGKTYRVILNARDFAGNRMETLDFEFKIEDAPE